MQDLLIANFSGLPEDLWQGWFTRNLAPGARWAALAAGAPEVEAAGPRILIYDPLDLAMRAALEAGDALAPALQAWEEGAGRVLALWRARRQEVLPVAADLLTGDAAPLRAALARWKDLPLAEADATPAAPPVPALVQMIARQPQALSRRIRRICDELAAAGPVRPAPAEDLAPMLAAAAELRDAAARAGDLAQRHAAAEAGQIRLEAEARASKAEAATRAGELAQLRSSAAAEKARFEEEVKASKAEAAARAGELAQLRTAAAAEKARLEAEAAAGKTQAAARREETALLREEAERLRRTLRETEALSIDRMTALEEAFATRRRELEQRNRQAEARGTAAEAEAARSAALAAQRMAEAETAAAAALARTAEIEAAGAVLAERTRQIEEMAEQEFRARAALDQARRDLAELAARAEAQAGQIAAQEATLAAQAQQIAALAEEGRLMREHALAQERRVAEFYASTSWRITAPLRATKRLIGG